MEKIYHVTASPIGDRGSAQAYTIHETETEAQWSALTHYVKTEGKYAYQIMTLLKAENEQGWQRVEAIYIVGGRMVSESEWLKAVGE